MIARNTTYLKPALTDPLSTGTVKVKAEGCAYDTVENKKASTTDGKGLLSGQRLKRRPNLMIGYPKNKAN